MERLTAHPTSRDAVVAAMWLLLGLASLQAGAYPLWSDIAVVTTSGGAFLLTLAGMVALATQRSRRPFTVLTLGIIVAGVDLLFGGSLGVVLILTDLIYAAVRYGSERRVRSALWAAVAVAVLLVAGLIVFRPEDNAVPVIIVQWGLIVAISGAWGWNVRSEQLRPRAAMVEQHTRVTRQLRHQIAHDLHDLVANQIAVAGLHVEAAKLLAGQASDDTAPLIRSLNQAKHGTDQAHRELRDLIAVLTAVDALDEPAPIHLQEELDELAQLLPADRSLVWIGDSAERMKSALDPQPDSRQRVVLRVLQELVANAAKHGVGDLTAQVTEREPDVAERESDVQRRQKVRLKPAEVIVTLCNASAVPGHAAAGTGLGIRGAGLLLGGIGATLATEPGEPWQAILTIPTTLAIPAALSEERRRPE